MKYNDQELVKYNDQELVKYNDQELVKYNDQELVKYNDQELVKYTPKSCPRNQTGKLPKLQIDMSFVVRKSVFGVSDLVRHKPGCAFTVYG